jgi:hypothetical protein
MFQQLVSSILAMALLAPTLPAKDDKKEADRLDNCGVVLTCSTRRNASS